MSEATIINAKDALKKLKKGNKKYVDSKKHIGDISSKIRKYTIKHGQNPYAVVVACGDSRVMPESIFSAGIGELFVIRVAGNVIGDYELASILYATEHLGTKLVVVMGHTSCGAVDSAIKGGASGYIKALTDEIKFAIGDETDPFKASCLNVENSIKRIRVSEEITKMEKKSGLVVCGGMYDTKSGKVTMSA